jgi:hypothetical protein
MGGAKAQSGCGYPAWKPNLNSEILNIKTVLIFGAFLVIMVLALINFLIGVNNMKMKITDK